MGRYAPDRNLRFYPETRILTSPVRILLQEQCGYHIAAFCGQHVVGAAGGVGVHGLQSDAFVHQWLQPGGVHETQLAAGAEDDEFGVEFGQCGEVLGRERGEVRAVPGAQEAAGAQQQVAAVFLLVDGQPAGAVPRDHLHVGVVSVEFHGGCSLWWRRGPGRCLVYREHGHRILRGGRPAEVWSNYYFT